MIYFAFILIGFSAIVTQVICVRELLIALTGNELTLGIYLSNWLFASAAGSYALTKIKFHHTAFPFLQIGTALFLPIVVILIRVNRSFLHLAPGEGIDLTIVFVVSFILLGILGFLSGAQFTAAYRFMAKGKDFRSGAHVYLFEALGSVVGGIITTFIMLTTFHNFLNVFFVSFLNLCSASYFFLTQQTRWKKYFSIVSLSVMAFLFVPLANYLHKTTISAQWPDYQVLEYQNSNYGNIALLQREQQLHLLNNGIPLAVAPTPDISHNEAMAHIPLLMHNSPRNIVLIGNGISGIPFEILKHPIQSLDYAELDPLIIDITHRYLPASLLPIDKRLSINKIDGRIFLKNTNKEFDIIYLNLPPPESLEINRFYTKEFFRLCKKRLRKGGILVFVLPASESYFTEDLSRMHNSILLAAEKYFSEKSIILNTSAIILLSDEKENLLRPVEWIIKKAAERGIQTQTINYANLRFKLNPLQREWYMEQIGTVATIEENSVFHPIAVFFTLLYWNAQHAPYLNDLFTSLEKIPLSILLVFPIIILIALFLLLKKKRSVLSVLIPIGITGYAGMGSTVILVLIFQSLYGYVYQWIGLIATAFMLGISAGTYGIIKTRADRDLQHLFFYFESAWIFQILFMLFFFNAMNSGMISESVFKLLLLILAGSAGLLVGGQFPVAIGLLHFRHYDDRAAGIVYAADLTGGWLGGISISIYLIPLFGIWSTCLFLLFLKLSTAIIVTLNRSFHRVEST